MINNPFAILIIIFCSFQACDNNPYEETSLPIAESAVNSIGKPATLVNQYNNTKGYDERGNLITNFDCPDDKSFPPVDIKSWNKIPIVNGRFPTYEETINGTSIHLYTEKGKSRVKLYPMTLPRLAYFKKDSSKSNTIVIVIQIVQTTQDTIIGYRYLSGGCGGSKFHNFHFLTDEDIRKVIE